MLAAGALCLLAACQDAPLAAPPADGGVREVTWQRPVHLGPSEVETARIEQAAPGFAGWYRNADGQAVVRVKAGGDAAAALAQVGRVLDAQAAGRGARPTTRVQTARYSFLELARFREVLRARLPRGVLSIDIVETRNVVHLGAADEAAVRRISAAAAALGVPAAAVEVQVEAPVQLYATLNDHLRPIRGGNSVRWRNDLPCTQSFNARIADGTAGFLTASHCTRTAYGPDATPAVFHQPSILTGSSFWQVGTEHRDPSFFTGGICPAFERCRWSDAAFVRFSGIAGASVNGFNTIHRTAWFAWAPGAPGSVDVTGTFTIVGDTASAETDVLYKVGRTTGWTQGVVLEKCRDQQVLDPAGRQFRIICSDLVRLHSGPGDSGSPVFSWDGVGDTVRWAGILYGGRTDGSDISLVSPVSSVRMDFPGISLFY